MPVKSGKGKNKKRRLTGYPKWVSELPRQSRSVPLGSAIDELTDRLGYKERLFEQSAVTNWEDVVGERIAKVTSPHSIEHGVLVVKVSKPAWRCELTFMKDDIRKKLNSSIGKPVVADIKFT